LLANTRFSRQNIRISSFRVQYDPVVSRPHAQGEQGIQENLAAGRSRHRSARCALLDARLPGSSENPMLAQLRRGKPCIKLLNKSDLSDPARLASSRKTRSKPWSAA
jgi:hypothetical protein